MKRREFLKSCLLAPAAPIAVASTEPKPVDKYDDPDYGVYYKTPFSIYTAREIEMMCREWGWFHVESFIPIFEGHKPPYLICKHGTGKFLARNKRQYYMATTFRTCHNYPDGSEQYEKFKDTLKWAAGNYWKPYRDYYFYDVMFEPHYTTIANAEWNKNREEVSCRVILSHIGIGKKDGEPWGTSENNT